MACVYPVGIPAVYAWCLARNRRDLVKSDRETLPHLQSLNTLWDAYKPSRYFFELVECTRLIALPESRRSCFPTVRRKYRSCFWWRWRSCSYPSP
ncbi:unnamed protein product [Laminaria digitata]